MQAIGILKLSDNGNRIAYIDSLRGLAIVSVILCHYIPHLILTYQLDFPSLSHYATYGKYGVHLFFIISGYVIYMTICRSHSVFHFASARFFRLYPAFWVAVTFSYIIITFFGHPNLDFNPDFKIYLINMTMLQRFFLLPSIDRVYWSLTFELTFYFYMAIFMVLHVQQHSFRYCAVWLLCSIAISLWVGTEATLSEQWKGAFLLEFNSFFLTGIAIYNFQQLHKKMPLWIIISLSLLQQFLFSGVELTVVYILATSLFFLFPYLNNLIASSLAKIGKISYSLYLIHVILGYSLINLFYHMNIPILLNISFTVIIAFSLAYIMWYTIELQVSKNLHKSFENHLRL